MTGNKDKTREPGFDTLVEQLEKHGSYEADALASNIKSIRQRALRLVSGEDQAEKEKDAEKKRQFIIGLAYADGDMQNGLKESIGLSKSDLDKMDEAGIGFTYSGDVMFGMSSHSDIIPFILPNGHTGALYISINAESGEFKYDFRKDIKRIEEENRLSVAGGIA